ncbi:MAG: hypothetical protein IJW25_02005, partial [Clostridia bacterium]|nr:hypothetical protein [Clostridia bacterium]
NAGTVAFQGFSYDGDSTIGDLSIAPIKVSQDVCMIVEDKTSDVVTINITPLNVGEATFTIQIENGKYVTLTIVVIRQIEVADFALQIKDTSENSLVSYTYKDIGVNGLKQKTLDDVNIKGIGGTVQLTESIYQYTDTNEYSYAFSIVVTRGAACFEIIDGTKLKATYFTGDNYGTYAAVKLSYNTVEGFKLAAHEEIVCEFVVSVHNYATDMDLFVSNGDEANEQTKSISIYNKNDLSYINQNLSQAFIYMKLKMSDHTQTLLGNTTYSISTTVNTEKLSDNVYKLGNVGYLYLTKYNEEGLSLNGEDYIAKFVCDITGFNTVSSFAITLRISDVGGVFESTININIEDYIDVTSIHLTTATDNIYLDATDKNKTVTVSAFVLPTDALCKDVQVFIETADTGCITFTQTINSIGNTVLTFTYNGGGSGYIRIFPVSNMKTSSPKDEYGSYYHHIAIHFSCADGSSEETALKLSTYEDLVNLNPSLYYFIDTLIDCGGNEVYIPVFSGHIRGTVAVVPNEELNDSQSEKYSPDEYKQQVELFNNSVQLGGIINFVVKNRGVNSGLIGNLTGELENLTISGKFTENQNDLDIKKDQDMLNLGILCGTNNGAIKNVQVSATNTSELKIVNKTERTSNTIVFVGVVAGVNNGVIEVNNNAKTSTLMVQAGNQLKLRFVNTEIEEDDSKKCYPITSYVGGVAGQNSQSGLIVNNYVSDMILVGMFGITANVNILATTNSVNTSKGFEGTNYGYLGGAVGQNLGNIKNLKITGYVENNYTSNSASAVGGLIGEYKHSESGGVVLQNTSRVYVRGRGMVCGLIGVFSLTTNYSKIANNKVQATDSAKMGVDASLIIKTANDPSAEYIFAISPVALDASNIAETYIDRSVVQNYVSNLDLEFYYGDLIIYYNSAITHSELFTLKSDEEIVIKAQEFALAIYKKAQQQANQTYIDNTILTADILRYAAGVKNCEVLISVDKNSMASIINYGKDLSINATGLLTITLKSALNYK